MASCARHFGWIVLVATESIQGKCAATLAVDSDCLYQIVHMAIIGWLLIPQLAPSAVNSSFVFTVELSAKIQQLNPVAVHPVTASHKPEVAESTPEATASFFFVFTLGDFIIIDIIIIIKQNSCHFLF